jgi:transmembrane sensor
VKDMVDGQSGECASHIQRRAADFLVARKAVQSWTAENEAELTAWLEKSLSHRVAFWRLQSVWDRADRLNALQPPSRPEGKTLSFSLRRIMLLGAVFVVGIAAVLSFLVLPPHTVTYATPVGGHRIIRLADGSTIELNTDTVVKTRSSMDSRNVELVNGEAIFNIRHDAAHPFTLRIENRSIIDLGTKFLVRKDGPVLKVELISGRVKLESSQKDEAPAILKPGDEAVATAESLSVKHKSEGELDSDLGWEHDMLVFQRATLDQVAREYNRYNERKIIIADSGAGARIITATLQAKDTDAFARMARDFLGLHVIERDSEIVISR